MSARRPAKPAGARPTAPRAAPPQTPDEGAHETAVPRYRVLSGGISTSAGAVYRGAIVTADELGDAERVTALLAKGAIEEVADD